ncbi:MAG: glycosyltransferase, partial [bacterium]
DLDRVRVPELSTREESLKRLGLPSAISGENKFVTIVSNMRLEVKNQAMFLRAARRVREVIPAAVFLLAGEGELQSSLQASAKDLGLKDAALFLGRCQSVADLLSISDVCVLSSKAEGFSNSLLEYMAAGRPVVATDVGGAREVVVDGVTGYLVSSDDDKAMAERIVSLLRDDSVSSAMGAEGRRVVLGEFSLDAQLRKTEELYDRLLKQNTVAMGRLIAERKLG